MNIRKLLLGIILILIFNGIFFSRALILETNSENSPIFMEQNFKQCSVQIKVREVRNVLENYVNFTINGKSYALKGFFGDYFCFSEGILLIAGYPGDPNAPSTEILFLDNSLNKKWWQYFARGLWFDSYQDAKIILTNGCVYWIEEKNGKSKYFCPNTGLITDVKESSDSSYVATTEGYVYLLKDHKLEKGIRVAKPWKGENLRMLVEIGVGEKYIAIVYSFVNPPGEEKRGLCVYTKNLVKLACRRLDYTPKEVVIMNGIIYVKDFYTGKIRAYRVYSLL
ncbi:hypothetical protein EP1X_08780 [Thermococcus sp. EP1]|uniref:hypothetical protein n=1 Tax=Thermococcus sp. EP1 TaxID=1591054 RepID=UPI0006DA67D7|nr:hypothetical protein [Thermococcus sp. EP1]KPU62433.1 hypothetical protein EP1X_08780 [Thermococcus sp. EP1]